VYQPRVSELNSLNGSVLVNIADKQSLASSLPCDPFALDSKPLALSVASTRYVINRSLWTTKGSGRSEGLLVRGHHGHLRYRSHCEQILEGQSDGHPGSPANLTHGRDFLTFGYNLSEHLAVLRVFSSMPGEFEGD
jgi:hypothetical protein